MINLTDRIVVLDQINLDEAIRRSIADTLACLTMRYGAPQSRVKWKSRHAIHYFFREDNVRENAVFDEVFLQAALAFNCTKSQNQGVDVFFFVMENYLHQPRPPWSAIFSIKQGIKMILVELWNQNMILLPTIFVTNSDFEPVPFSNELQDFVAAYNPKIKAKATRSKGIDATNFRIFCYMPRVLKAATWRKIEDINIYEFADLHRAQRLFMAGNSQAVISTSPFPWTLFLNEILNCFPDRVSYDKSQMKLYSQWLNGRELTKFSFLEFINIARQPKKDINIRAPVISKETVENKLNKLSIMPSHEAALLYFSNYRQRVRDGMHWLEELPKYPGREHVSLNGVIHLWYQAFRDFLHHRERVKGYESNKATISSLNILADYLFLYLPWWKELFPQASVEVPGAPKDFIRYAFIYRSKDERVSDFPVTLLEVIKLRRNTQHSQYSALKQIQLFFKFVEANFSENDDVAGPKFRTPIFDEFDMPKVRRRGKTSKIVFPKNSYGYLVFYGYAVEAFGQFLLERCMAGDFTQAQLRMMTLSRLIDTASFGFVPYVRYRGKIHPLKFVPNVFTWATRCVKATPKSSVNVLIPHLTTLRLLIVAVETGLRFAALRWLDRRTWDKDNISCESDSVFSFQPGGQYVYDLHVSSDKKKEGPWQTLVVFRARAVMLREQQFLLLIDESDLDKEVPYQHRSMSRFGNIRPLFRSASNINPITEDNYHSAWILYMTGFQGFLAQATGSFVPFVKIQPTSSTVANPKIVGDKRGIRYCPVSILAISTPHACRASFATNRQGILETSEIAELLGHDDPTVTEYYQSPRAEDLREKLEFSDRAIQSDYRRFDKTSAVYVRPDEEDSALVRNFKSDREKTMDSFGFMPPISIWKLAETEDMDEKAVEAFRNGPMSLIRFRETHICPVGEECPTEIVQAVGGFKRCGLCPLALKCVDHLPAIAAKKHALIERIKYLLRQKAELEVAGEVNSVEIIWEEIDLDTNELLGWQISEEILAKIYVNQFERGSGEVMYHAEQPDVVRRHLERIVKRTGATEFLLQRIAESNAYPSLQSPHVQAVAANIRRRLLAGRDVPDLLTDAPGPRDVTMAASLLKTVMKANQLTVEEISDQLCNSSVTLPPSAPLKIGVSK